MGYARKDVEATKKYHKRIRYYVRIQLLFIDDFDISRYSEEGIKILYHLIKLWDDLGTSTLFSCQYSPDEWGNQLIDGKPATHHFAATEVFHKQGKEWKLIQFTFTALVY